MNFLAHFYLSDNDPQWMIGNVVADFIRGKEKFNFNTKVIEGIEIHRYIDFYTDHHPNVKKCIELIKPQHKKYSPVILDIYFDYALAQSWDKYSTTPLINFADFTYDVLHQHIDDLPQKLRDILPFMVEENWLYASKDHKHLQRTMKRMDKRTSFPSNFEGALDTIKKHEDDIHHEFEIFFPELIKATNEYIIEKGFSPRTENLK